MTMTEMMTTATVLPSKPLNGAEGEAIDDVADDDGAAGDGEGEQGTPSTRSIDDDLLQSLNEENNDEDEQKLKPKRDLAFLERLEQQLEEQRRRNRRHGRLRQRRHSRNKDPR